MQNLLATAQWWDDGGVACNTVPLNPALQGSPNEMLIDCAASSLLKGGRHIDCIYFKFDCTFPILNAYK